jgi:hypothetical protein
MTSGKDELHLHVQTCPYHPHRQHGHQSACGFAACGTQKFTFYVREHVLLKRSLRELAARKLADMLRTMTSQEFERFSGECALGHPAQRCSSLSLARNALLPYLALLTNRPSHCRTTAFWDGQQANMAEGSLSGDREGHVTFVNSGISTENARRVAASSRAGSPEMEDVDIGPVPDAIASLPDNAACAAVEALLDTDLRQVFRALHAQAQELRLHATAKTVAAALFSCEWNQVEAMATLVAMAPQDHAGAALDPPADAGAALDRLSLELLDLPPEADVDLLARTCADHMARPDQAGGRCLGFADVQKRLKSLVEMGWCMSLAMSDPAIC